ncbi:metallophosphoesterase [Legionella septentrionalis]|uniref:Metallophosphoesterase n=2 Tax=Legionella septentrionalis TaxID=2498109 RepID=A0A433JKR1_9GAMM|nr:metallophosphoesterase [Legionella septentrionalis]RUQ97338.1 metallophosphoesterase [Legionella septentrionalis]
MKILHISDLHFGMHKPDILDFFLKDVDDIKPDIILVSGDCTQRALKEQYQELLAFLRNIKTEILIVPGNHDVPLYDVFERFFSPFKPFNTHVSCQYGTEFKNDKIRILGVNSVNPYRVKNGKISQKTLQKIKYYFKQPFSGLSILFFHHNFDHLYDLHKPLKNYQQLVNYLPESHIDLICTGHLHYANLSLIKKNNNRSALILHAGSLSCARKKDAHNSYFLIETTKNGCRIELRIFDERGFLTLQEYDIDFSKYFSQLNHLLLPPVPHS